MSLPLRQPITRRQGQPINLEASDEHRRKAGAATAAIFRKTSAMRAWQKGKREDRFCATCGKSLGSLHASYKYCKPVYGQESCGAQAVLRTKENDRVRNLAKSHELKRARDEARIAGEGEDERIERAWARLVPAGYEKQYYGGLRTSSTSPISFIDRDSTMPARSTLLLGGRA